MSRRYRRARRFIMSNELPHNAKTPKPQNPKTPKPQNFKTTKLQNSQTSLWVGYQIPDNTYSHVYSRHEKVVNFVQMERIISLCNSPISPAPWRITNINIDLSKVTEFSLTNGSLFLPDLPSLQYRIYRPPVFTTMPARGHENLALANQYFQANYHPLCVQSLVDGKADSTFSRALAQRYSLGMQLFQDRNIQNGVEQFLHTGYGLTPSGDDFLVGMLIFLAWQAKTGKKELSKIRDAVFFASRSKNLLVDTFLQQAVEMDLCQDWANFLAALAHGEVEIYASVDRILLHGSSSGSDELSGFFAAWQIFD